MCVRVRVSVCACASVCNHRFRICRIHTPPDDGIRILADLALRPSPELGVAVGVRMDPRPLELP